MTDETTISKPSKSKSTVEVYPELHARMKQAALDRKLKLKDAVGEALEYWLSGTASTMPPVDESHIEKILASFVTQVQNKSLIIPQRLFGNLAQQISGTISPLIVDAVRKELKVLLTGRSHEPAADTDSQKNRVTEEVARIAGSKKRSGRSSSTTTKRVGGGSHG